MDLNYVYLLFDENYYQSLLSDQALNDSKIIGGWQYYLNNDFNECSVGNLSECRHLNSYLANNIDQLTSFNNDSQRIEYILHKDKVEDKFYQLLNSYFSKVNNTIFFKQISQTALNCPAVLEDLVGQSVKYKYLGKVVFGLRIIQPYQLNNTTISLLKNDWIGTYTRDVANILIHDVSYFSNDESHISFLVKIVNEGKYKKANIGTFIIENLPAALLNRSLDGYDFSGKAFEEMQLLISLNNHNVQLLKFLAIGAANKLYSPNKVTTKLLPQIINAAGFEEISKKAIFNGLEAELNSQHFDISFIEEIIFNLSKHYIYTPPNLIEKIVDEFAKQTHAEKIAEQSTLNFLNVITNLVSSKHTISQAVMAKLVEPLLKLAVSTTEPDQLKKAFFLIARISENHINFPEEIVSILEKFLSSSDIKIQRIVTNLFKKFDQHLTREINANIAKVALESADLQLKYEAYNLLFSVNNNLENEFTSGLIENINRNLSESEINLDLDVVLSKLDTFSMPGKQREAIASKIRYLHEQFNWSLSGLAALMQNLTEENLFPFTKVIERLFHYKISEKLIDRDGNSILDLVHNSKTEEWSKRIKRLHDDNNFNYPRNKEEIFQTIRENNSPLIAATLIESIKYILEEKSKEDKKLEDIFNNIEVTIAGQIEFEKAQSNKCLFFIQDGKIKCKTVQGDKEEIWSISNPKLKILDELQSQNHFLNHFLKQGYEIVFTEVKDKKFTQPNKIHIYFLNDKLRCRFIGPHNTTYTELIKFDHIVSIHDWARYERIENLIKQGEKLLKQSEVIDLKIIYRDMWLSNYSKSITKVDKTNLPEILAVCAKAMHYSILGNKYFVKDVQLAAVLAALETQNGRFLQVATGEGKSVIIDILAAIKVISGLKVDIMTSSEVLAKRDCYIQSPFYEKLGITVDHAIKFTSPNEPKTLYASDVVYGSSLSLMGDYLREETVANYRVGRSFDVIIIDEVDDLSIDNVRRITKLAETIPGFEHLTPVLENCISTLMPILNQIDKNAAGNFCIKIKDTATANNTLAEDSSNQGNKNTEDIFIEEEIGDFDKLIEFLTNKLSEYIKSNSMLEHESHAYMNGMLTQKFIFIPNHLNGYLKAQLHKWVESFIRSLQLQEGQDYVIRANPNSIEQIKIHDKDTGVIQLNMQWSHGLHQLLAIKHRLQVDPESLTSIFITMPGYILRYKDNIFGLTGTLGTEDHQQFVSDIYGVDTLKIPTFAPQNLFKYPPQVVNTPEEWFEAIAYSAASAIDESRGVLILTTYINTVNQIYEFLISKGLIKENLIKYYDSDDEEIINKPVSAGKVIIATNLAGRGTDLKITPQVGENGGIHVIFTFYPDSSRVQDQGFGRSARKGEPGSAELIIINNAPELDINELNANRTLAQKDFMEKSKSAFLPIALLKDSIHNKRAKLAKELSSPTGYKIIENYDLISENLAEKEAYILHEGNKIFLQSSIINNAQPVDITESLEMISHENYRHILGVLSDPKKSAILDIGDIELIHFYLAKHDINLAKQNIARINTAYSKAIQKLIESHKFPNIEDQQYNTQGKKREFCKAEIQYLTDKWYEKYGYLKPFNLNTDISPLELQKTKEIILFELWQEDHKYYNKEFELKQLKENFAIWFEAILNTYDLDNPHLFSTEALNDTIKNVNQDWDKFADETRATFAHSEYVRNPSYLTRHAMFMMWDVAQYHQKIGISNFGSINLYLEQSITSTDHKQCFLTSFPMQNVITQTRESISMAQPFDIANTLLTMSINKDYKYSAPAYHLRSLIPILKNQNIRYLDDSALASEIKLSVYQDLSQAYKVYQGLKSKKESECIFELIVFPPKDSPLIKSCFARVLFLEAIIEGIRKSIETVEAVLNNGEMAIRISSSKSIENVFNEIGSKAIQERIEITYVTLQEKQQNSSNTTGAVINAASLNDNSTTTNAVITNFTNTNATNADALNENLYPNIKDDDDLNTIFDKFLLFQKNTQNSPLANKFPSILQEAQIQGIIFYSIETYQLEDNSDWMDTFFAGVVGIAFLVAGLALAASGAGVFAVALGNSLALNGAMNLISLGINIAQGQKINLEDFMKAQAVNLAISAITAGLAHYLHAAKIITDISSLISPLNIYKVMGIAALNTALGYAVQEISTSYQEKNSGNIRDEVYNKINALFEEHKEELKLIFNTVSFENNNAFIQELSQIANQVVVQRSAEFHTPFTTIAKGSFGAGLGMLAGQYIGGSGSFWSSAGANFVGNSAVNLGVGYVEASNAIDEAKGKLAAAIKNLARQATPTSKMMERYLTVQLSNDAIRATAIMQTINFENSWFISEQNIKHDQCSKIGEDSFNLAAFATDRELIKLSCKEVESFLSIQNEAFPEKLNQIKGTISAIIFSRVSNIWQESVTKPAIDWALGSAVSYAKNQYDKNSEIKLETSNHQSNPQPQSVADDINKLVEVVVAKVVKAGKGFFKIASEAVSSLIDLFTTKPAEQPQEIQQGYNSKIQNAFKKKSNYDARAETTNGKTYPSPAVWSEESQQKARDTFASPKFRKEIETLGEYDREITLGFFNEINAEAQKSSAIIEKSLDQKVLEVAAEKIRDLSDKYLKFAAENPLLAEYGLSALSIAAQTALAGLAGLVKSTATEITARAAGYLTAEQIASFISDRRADVGAKLQKSYPQMEANNIETLAAAIVLGPVLVAFGAMGAKQLINDISTIAGKLNPNRFAIAGGKDFDNFNFENHDPVASGGQDIKASHKEQHKLDKPDLAKIYQSNNVDDIIQALKKYEFDLPREVFDKIPSELGAPHPNKYGVGIKWLDLQKKGAEHSIRIDKADMGANFPHQRVDHVKIIYKGKTIDINGNPIVAKDKFDKTSMRPEAHIPLTEWLKWRSYHKK